MKSQNNKLLLYIWFIITISIIYCALIPFDFLFTFKDFNLKLSQVSWKFFYDNDNSFVSIPDLVQNIIFFLPFGFIGILYLENNFFKTIFLGIILSFGVELLQLFTLNRISSVTDLATNTIGTFIGCIIGYGIFLLIKVSKIKKYIKEHCNSREFFFLFIAFILIFITFLEPFDFSLDFGLLKSKVKKIIKNYNNFSFLLFDEFIILIQFVFFAYLAGSWFKKTDTSYFRLRSFMLGISIGVLLEMTQLIVHSRLPTGQDLFPIILGTFFGAFLSKYHIYLKKHRKKCALISIIATYCAVFIRMISPFQFTAKYTGINWLPFLPYYNQTIFLAMANFIEVLFIYIPFAIITLYCLESTKSKNLLIIIIICIIAIPIELLQGFTINRYPDITDICASIAGGFIGILIYTKGWNNFNKFCKNITTTATVRQVINSKIQ